LADVDVENVEMFISEISDFLWMGIFGFIWSRVTLTRHQNGFSFFWFIIANSPVVRLVLRLFRSPANQAEKTVVPQVVPQIEGLPDSQILFCQLRFSRAAVPSPPQTSPCSHLPES
jgi:hypothetical protein